MKRLALLVKTLLLSIISVEAQISGEEKVSEEEHQVSVTAVVKKIADTTYEVSIFTTVKYPWHIYSKHSPLKGPKRANIIFAKNAVVTLIGEMQEKSKPQVYWSSVYGGCVAGHAGTVEYVQSIRI